MFQVFLDDEAAHRVADQYGGLVQPVDNGLDVFDVIGNRISVDMFASATAAMATQRQCVAWVPRFGEKGHEGFGPHPASGEGAVDEQQRLPGGFAGGEAGEDFDAFDDLSF